MKICITAANCFIGLPLVRRAADRGWDVVAVVREGNSQKEMIGTIPNTSVVELNLEEYSLLGEKVGTIDCLVMLTWDGTRGKARSDENLQANNYECCYAAIESVIKHGCKKIVTAGSQAEYGNVNGIITEETVCNPNTEYGKYKLKLYNSVSKLCARNNVAHIETRFFSLYGPGDFENTLIMANIRKMLKNEVCDMTACSQLWDYLYIDDAVDALEKLCARGNSGIYNFGSGNIKPLYKYVEEMKLVIRSKSELNFGAVPYGSKGPVSIQPSVKKLQNEINWKAQYSFKDGIEKILENIHTPDTVKRK